VQPEPIEALNPAPDAAQIEEDLRKCEALALRGLAPWSQGEVQATQTPSNLLQNSSRSNRSMGRASAASTPDAAAKSRAAKLDELLVMLENAPQGPVELDTTLLYSPRRTSSHTARSASPGSGSSGTKRTCHVAFSEDELVGASDGDSAGALLLPGYQPSTEEASICHAAQYTSSAMGVAARSAPLPDSQEPGHHVPRTSRAPTDRLQALAAPRTTLWQRLQRVKADMEAEALAECTFAPRTGRAPARHLRAPDLLPEERLMMGLGKREAALARARQEAQEAELQGCTFAPQVGEAGRKGGGGGGWCSAKGASLSWETQIAASPKAHVPVCHLIPLRFMHAQRSLPRSWRRSRSGIWVQTTALSTSAWPWNSRSAARSCRRQGSGR
jgi:hypothetical protein